MTTDERIALDSESNNLELALKKVTYLASLMDDYLVVKKFAKSMAEVEEKKKDMFLINVMMQDYLEDIELALDGIKTEIMIAGDLAEKSEV